MSKKVSFSNTVNVRFFNSDDVIYANNYSFIVLISIITILSMVLLIF